METTWFVICKDISDMKGPGVSTSLPRVEVEAVECRPMHVDTALKLVSEKGLVKKALADLVLQKVVVHLKADSNRAIGVQLGHHQLWRAGAVESYMHQ